MVAFVPLIGDTMSKRIVWKIVGVKIWHESGKDAVIKEHTYCPDTKEEALNVGHELVRNFVMDYFKVVRCIVDE
jgi:hypothetical protein